MSYKIPPSLNWLINKHARISGEIIKIQKRLTKVSLLVDRLRELEKNLEAVNSSLRLHEIQIDAKNIKPIRPTRKKSNFPWGEQQNIIFKIIKTNSINGPVSKITIMEQLAEKHLEYGDTELADQDLRRITAQGLNRLARNGYIIRLHDKISNDYGLWSIHPDLNDSSD